ncbi:MAG: hypothetical protein K6E29_03190 [Cyanobacteria bacterium RUI128]|nr:hypothetical protein [Cyanobacteria bacterium RUI128]
MESIKNFPIEIKDKVGVFLLAHYKDLILKIKSDYLDNPETIPKDIVPIPVKYSDDVISNPNFGLYLYHVDKRDSEFAQKGYANPKDVIVLDKASISIIKRVSGKAVYEDYIRPLGSVEGVFNEDPHRKQFIILKDISSKYGREAVLKALDFCKEGVTDIKEGQLADNSEEYKFVIPDQYYVNYKNFVVSYLTYLKNLANLPQKTYDNAVTNILTPKEFVFDFVHTANTFIDWNTQEFNFIDFNFDDETIKSMAEVNMIELFRNVLAGIHKNSKTQPMDYICYPDDVADYENSVHIITEKINQAAPQEYKIKEEFFRNI